MESWRFELAGRIEIHEDWFTIVIRKPYKLGDFGLSSLKHMSVRCA